MTTIAERAWMDAITQLGCIACRRDGFFDTPGAVHHLLSGGRRIGHLDTICLCDPGHHQKGGTLKVSRHPDKARFEAEYGTEASLLKWTRELVEQRLGLRIVDGAVVRDGVDIDRIPTGAGRCAAPAKGSHEPR